MKANDIATEKLNKGIAWETEKAKLLPAITAEMVENTMKTVGQIRFLVIAVLISLIIAIGSILTLKIF